MNDNDKILDMIDNLNQASLILANKRYQIERNWTEEMNRACEVLEHAQTYLSHQALELGDTLEY